MLRSGFVLVGNVPAPDGKTVVPPGSLLVIGPQGNLVTQLSSAALLDGPWDMTVIDRGQRVTAFVSNVLNGTVSRIELAIGDNGVTMLPPRVIASGYVNRTDPSALVVGPTGLAYDRNSDVLYVASTGDNAVFAIQNAASTNRNGGVGRMIYFDAAHLHGPLALALAPNGHLVTANGDAVNADPQQPSEIVEFTVDGRFIAQMQVDTVPGPRSASRSGTAAKASWNSQPSTTTRIPRRSGPCAPTTTTRSNAPPGRAACGPFAPDDRHMRVTHAGHLARRRRRPASHPPAIATAGPNLRHCRFRFCLPTIEDARA